MDERDPSGRRARRRPRDGPRARPAGRDLSLARGRRRLSVVPRRSDLRLGSVVLDRRPLGRHRRADGRRLAARDDHEVPRARRADAGGRLPPRARGGPCEHPGVHEPTLRGDLRLPDRGADGRPGSVVEDPPSRRPRARARGRSARRRNGRTVLDGLPHRPQGRLGRVDPRRDGAGP